MLDSYMYCFTWEEGGLVYRALEASRREILTALVMLRVGFCEGQSTIIPSDSDNLCPLEGRDMLDDPHNSHFQLHFGTSAFLMPSSHSARGNGGYKWQIFLEVLQGSKDCKHEFETCVTRLQSNYVCFVTSPSASPGLSADRRSQFTR